eukprot:10684768-Heterocapsa_arctica.AAC.1
MPKGVQCAEGRGEHRAAARPLSAEAGGAAVGRQRPAPPLAEAGEGRQGVGPPPLRRSGGRR